MKVVMWAFLIDMIIMPTLFIKLFFIQSAVPVITKAMNDRGSKTGLQTTLLMQRLLGTSSPPVAPAHVTRSPFTVDGKVIALEGDNIQVFEYADHDSAMKDALILAGKFAPSATRPIWKKDMHVYVNDKLAIFYMGHSDLVMNSLKQNAGVPLTSSDKPLSMVSKISN